MLQVLGQAARALGVAGKLAMLPILLLALIVGLTSRGVVRSFSVPSASENVTPTPKDRTAEMAARVEQFRGRSLFFIPGPPPREAPVVIEDRPAPVGEVISTRTRMDAACEAVVGVGSGMWRCNMASGKHDSATPVNCPAHAVFA